jgi:hypothetical protein
LKTFEFNLTLKLKTFFIKRIYFYNLFDKVLFWCFKMFCKISVLNKMLVIYFNNIFARNKIMIEIIFKQGQFILFLKNILIQSFRWVHFRQKTEGKKKTKTKTKTKDKDKRFNLKISETKLWDSPKSLVHVIIQSFIWIWNINISIYQLVWSFTFVHIIWLNRRIESIIMKWIINIIC